MSAARKSGLGRGLDALIQDEPPARSGVEMVAVDRLQPNRYQPRSNFDESGLEELAESIKAQGVIQPIVAVPAAGGGHGYVIVAGERRWRAAQRAGLDEVPVVVREVSGDQELLELALVENLQRADLNPVEEAEAYRTLQETFSLSQDAIATRVGKARTTVTNTLRLLRLPDEVMDMLRDGRLTAGQARPLLALDGEDEQVELARRAVTRGMTARQLEQAVKPAQGRKGAKAAQKKDVHTTAAEERLTRHLQTKVEISRRGERGQLRIHFHSEEELMRIFDLLMVKNQEA